MTMAAATEEDDDDFEDLFSFGAPSSAPGGAATERTKTPTTTSTFSDYDILNDVCTPGGVIAGSHVTGGAGVGTTTAAGATAGSNSSAPTPRFEGGGEDDFDSLFGTPPVTPDTDTTRSPLELTSSKSTSLDSAAALPPPTPIDNDDDRTNTQHHETLSMIDDFHVHDEETRDMLEWLDDDTTGKKTNVDEKSTTTSNIISSAGDGGGEQADLPYLNNENDDDDDDDFDFDQMLADVDVALSPKRAPNDRTKAISSSAEGADVQSSIDPNESVKPPPSDTTASTTFDSMPTPPSFPKPPLSASIENELSLDQWDDDDDEQIEAEDLQTPSDAAANDTHHILTNTTTDSSPSSGHNKDASASNVDELITQPSPPQKKIFTSLEDAVRSNLSTTEDVRSLFARERGGGFHNNDDDDYIGVRNEDRAHLWAKIICGKTFEDIDNGSLAESYREWDSKWEVPKELEGGEFGKMVENLLNEGSGARKGDNDDYEAKKRQLMSVSYFQCCNKTTLSSSLSSASSLGIDSLIPPVALAILESGFPPASASVVLSQIEPSAMPLLRLAHEERYLAAKALHSEFYLLACYHLPLLVMHLDRHCPGWYWPKAPITVDDGCGEPTHDDENGKVDSTNEDAEDGHPGESTVKDQKKSDLDQNGLVPLSWFVTNFAGEFGGSCLNHHILLQLWDNILTEGDHSWKYFLAIAILDKKSDLLLMSRGDELKRDLEKIVNFQAGSTTRAESFVGGSSEGNQESTNCVIMAREWLAGAKSLMDSTPSSVIELLRSADDRAVASAIKVRQTKLDQEVQAQLEKHEEAQRREREERRKEADRELNKARLIAYYRTYNPEKVDTIDQILKLFDGRMEVLNEKLTKKVCSFTCDFCCRQYIMIAFSYNIVLRASTGRGSFQTMR